MCIKSITTYTLNYKINVLSIPPPKGVGFPHVDCNFITSIQTKFYIIIIIFYTSYFIFHIYGPFRFLYIIIITYYPYNSCIFYSLFTTRNMYVL